MGRVTLQRGYRIRVRVNVGAYWRRRTPLVPNVDWRALRSVFRVLNARCHEIV